VLDESTIVATADTVQLPNYVSGNSGKHLTFGGDLILENNNAVEFGKGEDTQGGKIKYGGVNLDIYGAGKTGDPYKIKLWDNVEVGGLLQTGDIQLGDSARINVDKNANHLAIKGSGKDGERKVKIWDHVEVGKLLANNGMEVKGAFHAYNDMNVLGKMNANGGLSVKGDLDVSGKINNPDIANRLTQIDNFLKDPKLGAGAVDPKLVQDLQTHVSGMSNTVQGQFSKLRKKYGIR
jgi:cytoskeletal protein CcmA (bactofilin family)